MLLRPREYQPHFDAICRFAKAQDKAGLRHYLRDNELSVGLKIDDNSPIKHLAKQGMVHAVNFLITHFHGYASHALMGYAEAGLTNEVNALLNDPTMDANIDYAAWGYARQSFVNEAEALLAQGADSADAILGYAEAGLSHDVERLLKKDYCLINFAVFGYAMRGEFALVDDLCKRGGSIASALDGYGIAGHCQAINVIRQNITQYDECIISSYVYGGHYDAANAIFKPDDPGHVRILLASYAVLGYVSEVNILLKQYPDLYLHGTAILNYAKSGLVQAVNDLLNDKPHYYRVAACGYAKAGLPQQVDAIIAIHPCAFNDAIRGYAALNHTGEVNRLLQSHATPHLVSTALQAYFKRILICQIETLLNSLRPNFAIHINDDMYQFIIRKCIQTNEELCYALALFNNRLHRHELANKVREFNNHLDVDGMLKIASKIHRIMQNYQLDYQLAQALFTKNMRIWILQGQQAVTKDNDKIKPIDPTVHLLITEQLLNLSKRDTLTVMHAVQRHHINMMQQVAAQTTPLTRGKQKKLELATDDSNKRYQNTMGRLGLFTLPTTSASELIPVGTKRKHL